jgi:hypothetical protein
MTERFSRTWRLDGHVVEVFGHVDAWRNCLDELTGLGIGVPLVHRISWINELKPLGQLYLAVRDASDGSLSAAVPVQKRPTRSLPGHSRLRVTYFGYAPREDGLAAAAAGLERYLVDDPKSLSATVEVFLARDDARERLERHLPSLGYERARAPRTYRQTLRLDLSPDEDALFGSFAPTCRRFIRAPEKKGFTVRTMDDPQWAERMDTIWKATFARTGARAPSRNWSSLLEFAGRHPEEFRIVGAFGHDYPEPLSLTAFACGMNNSDHAAYTDGASCRDIGASVPLSYAPMWNLIRWAKSMGCEWFDLGGITEGHHGDAKDPLGGISDFKRRFTDRVVTVGSEWELKPVSWRTALSDRVAASGNVVRRLSSGFSR